MLLTGLQYQSVLVTLIRFQHVRKSEASFIRISPHNGACFHVENSTRLLLIRYFNHLLCSTFGPTVPLWRVIKRLWSSSRRKNSWHCSGEALRGSVEGVGVRGSCSPGPGWWGTNCVRGCLPCNVLFGYSWAFLLSPWGVGRWSEVGPVWSGPRTAPSSLFRVWTVDLFRGYSCFGNCWLSRI